jgi:myosin heavy subunit
MPEHKVVLEGLRHARPLIDKMGADGKPLAAKVDKIIAGLAKAGQLRDGYKSAQTKLTTLKKDVDDQAKKVADAKTKNDELHKKQLDAVKEVQTAAVAAEKLPDVQKDKKLGDVVGRLKVWSDSDFKHKYLYWDDEGYEELAKKVQDKRNQLPKAGSKMPKEMDELEKKVDALVKHLKGAGATAKGVKTYDKQLADKKKAYDDFQTKVQPIETALGQQLGQTATELNDAAELRQHIDHTGSTEAYQRYAAVAKALNDASADVAPTGKASDAKTWTASP